jgi:hypothetical protein
LAALIRAGRPEHQWRVSWEGRGKKAAEAEENLLIKKRCDEGCLLANFQHNPNHGGTVDQILDYLGVKLPLSSTPKGADDGNHKHLDVVARVLDEAAAAARARDIRLLTLRTDEVAELTKLIVKRSV